MELPEPEPMMMRSKCRMATILCAAPGGQPVVPWRPAGDGPTVVRPAGGGGTVEHDGWRAAAVAWDAWWVEHAGAEALARRQRARLASIVRHARRASPY